MACDDTGKFEEYIPKERGHTGEGRRHQAIAVLLSNSNGEVLLQKRKHQVFNNIWDITGATHPLHREDGSNESLEEATRRCLKDEWGIREVGKVREVGVYNYFAKMKPSPLQAAWYPASGTSSRRTIHPRIRAARYSGSTINDLCENEHCHLFLGEYDGNFKLNSEVGYEHTWMGKKDFLKDIQKNPGKYTPWAIKAAELLKEMLVR